MEEIKKGDHLTVRVHNTKLIEQMNYILAKNPFTYKYKNDLLIELLTLGVNEKMKELNVGTSKSQPASTKFIVPMEMGASLKQVKAIIENMHIYNQKHIEGIVAHLKMSERLSAAIYNTLLAIATDEPITKVQITMGIMDEVPERFETYLNELLNGIFRDSQMNKEEGGDVKS